VSITAPPAPPPPSAAPGTSRTITTLWRIGGALVVVPMLVYGVYQVVIALAHEEQTLRRSFDAAGITTLEVHNQAGGSVQVVGADIDTIRVRARVSHGLRRTDHSERVEGDRVVLASSCPLYGTDFCSVSYTVEVPSDIDLLLRTDSGRVGATDIDGTVDIGNDTGSIELVQVTGDINVHTDTGRIDASGLTGAQADASTDTGRIHLDFDVAPQAVQASTDTGSVEVVLPDDTATYRVETGTDTGGEVVSVRTDPSSTRSIVARTDTGDITIRYR
jgi:hypothetical protein